MRLHIVFSSEALTCKVFGADGSLEREFPMRDHAMRAGFGHWGRCPRGTYQLAMPVRVHEPAMGDHFIPVLAVPGREGIGIHGGGTGLPDPFAPRQGWVLTHGCLRMQNADLEWIAGEMDAGSEITVKGP